MSNVEGIKGNRYPIFVAQELSEEVEAGNVMSVVVIRRNSRGEVTVDWSVMDSDVLAHMALFLQKTAMDNI